MIIHLSTITNGFTHWSLLIGILLQAGVYCIYIIHEHDFDFHYDAYKSIEWIIHSITTYTAYSLII